MSGVKSTTTVETPFNPVVLPSWMQVLLWIVVAGVFAASPFWSGLYFYTHLQPFAIGISVIAGILGIWLWSSRIHLRVQNGWLTFYPYLILLAFIYCINAWLSPANKSLAVEGIVRQFSTLGVVFLVTVLFQTLKARKGFLGLTLVTGAWTSLFALAAGYGTIHYNGTIMQPGNRLSSVFQYANTNASFAAAFVFVSFFFPLLLKNRVAKALTSIATYLMLLNLTLTYSRGGWITFAILTVILLFLLPKVNRWPLLFANSPPLLVFAVTLSFQTKAVQGTLQTTGWISLLIGILLAGVFSFAIGNMTEGRSFRLPKWTLWAFLGVVVLAIVFGVYKILRHGTGNNSILSRITNISLQSHSVQERFIYYKDGLKMFLQHPILGDGYGTWQALFSKFQSFPYYSKHEHSYWIQLLTESGVVGLVLFITAVVFFVRSIILSLRTEKKENVLDNQTSPTVTVTNQEGVQEQKLIAWISLFVVASILFHASIDFDMSYSLMNFLLWGMMAVGVHNVRFEKMEKKNSKPSLSWSMIGSYTVGIVAMFATVIVGATSMAANNNYQMSIHATDPTIGLQNADNARLLAPYNGQYVLVTAAFADQSFLITRNQIFSEQALYDVDMAIGNSPYDSEILMRGSQIDYRYGQFTKALDYAKQAYEDSPYGQPYTEQYMVYLAFQAEENLKKDAQLTKQYSETICNVWQSAQDRVKQIQALPSYLPPEKQFAISSQMKLRVAEAYILLGQAEQARILVQELSQSNDGNIALTAKMLWNVMLDKHMVEGQANDVEQQMDAIPNIKHEYDLLK